jgi:serine/threonine protein kinase
VNENKLYAAKVMSKFKTIEEGTIRYIQNEKFILEHMKSDFLLKLEGFFQTERNLYFITECLEGDLYNLIKSNRGGKKYLPEEAVSFYTLSIAIALQTLHDLHFTYRDLKPENVLINNKGYPVLCDFGLINLLIPTGKAYTMCGTPEYFAPEIITSSSYDQRVDWWTLGIMVYELIFGETPFNDENTYSLYEKILNNPIRFPKDTPVSEAAKDLILKLLNRNQEKRLGSKNGINELINHPFYLNIDIHKLLNQQVIG